MNIIENAEKECAILGSLFQGIVNEMKVSIFTYHNIQLLTICQWNKKDKANTAYVQWKYHRIKKTFEYQGSHHYYAYINF